MSRKKLNVHDESVQDAVIINENNSPETQQEQHQDAQSTEVVKKEEFEELRQLVAILIEENERLKATRMTGKKVIEMKDRHKRNSELIHHYATKAHFINEAAKLLLNSDVDSNQNSIVLSCHNGHTEIFTIRTVSLLSEVLNLMRSTADNKLLELEAENQGLIEILGEI